MSKLRVLLDTNVIVSGLVFPQGNEHRILELAEEQDITLILPEFVLQEAKYVFSKRFVGYEFLLDIFLSKTDYRLVNRARVGPLINRYQGAVRDPKDIAILVSVLLSKPDCTVTGDKTLRFDLQNILVGKMRTTVFSPKQFLDFYAKTLI